MIYICIWAVLFSACNPWWGILVSLCLSVSLYIILHHMLFPESRKHCKYMKLVRCKWGLGKYSMSMIQNWLSSSHSSKFPLGVRQFTHTRCMLSTFFLFPFLDYFPFLPCFSVYFTWQTQVKWHRRTIKILRWSQHLLYTFSNNAYLSWRANVKNKVCILLWKWKKLFGFVIVVGCYWCSIIFAVVVVGSASATTIFHLVLLICTWFCCCFTSTLIEAHRHFS